MTTRSLWDGIRVHWKRLLAGAIIGGVLAGLALLVLPTTYTSQAKILITADATADGGPIDGQDYVSRRMATMLELGDSDAVHAGIREQTGTDLARGDLEDRITYSAASDSSIVEVQAEGRSAEDAQELAAAATTALGEDIVASSTPAMELTTEDIQQATAPTSATRPDPLVVVPAGLILGIGIAVLTVLAQSPRPQPRHRETTVSHPDESR
ncbi:MAG: hypothetical protein Q4G40_07450 [Brachybacterium sp.]|nr:hypothetical protein [Brachybacterium sp.]